MLTSAYKISNFYKQLLHNSITKTYKTPNSKITKTINSKVKKKIFNKKNILDKIQVNGKE